MTKNYNYSKSEYFGENRLLDIARELATKKIFLGGPTELFEIAGRNALIVLLKNGIYPSSTVLDVGCGLLRCGFWIINFLNPSCYFGIEPNQKMLDLGKKEILGEKTLNHKKPNFSNNDEFNFECFDVKFDFVLARSIWTHASKQQICKMLDSFIKTKTKNGTFLTTFVKSETANDYKGKEWIGRSHKSDKRGIIKHDLNWIKNECLNRKLNLIEIQDKIGLGHHTWLRIT